MRIYLAATNTCMSKELRAATIAKCKPRYILETFFNGAKACDDAMSVVGNDCFILDSGAYSFMNGAKVTLPQMDTYVERYAAYIVQRGVRQYIEADVDNIFGLQQVEAWRRRIESAAGRPCIPVWHKGRGVEYWKWMCRSYKYVAVGGLVFHVMKQEYDLIRKLVEYAHERDVKVHGLGFTKTQLLPQFKFYSVDSATWALAATRGQQIHSFQDGIIKQRSLEKGSFKADLGKLAAHNMAEWCKFQKYMDGVRV